MAALDAPNPSQPMPGSTPPVPPTAAYDGQGPIPGTHLSLSSFAAPGHEPPTLEDKHPRQELTYVVSQRIGPYEIVDKIDEGGMGVVFKVRDSRLQRFVALKMVRGGLAAGLGDLLRFQREAQVQARIQHRHLLPVFDVGLHQGDQYFTMPLAAGGSLAKHLAEYTGQPTRIVPLMEKVARAVDHAHRHGIFHRDLKPSNILLDEEGEPLVADFGLAKIVDASCDLTGGRILGTPPYMAPEQTDPALGHLIDARTDVWSIGVLLYELLTGQRPFTGADNTEILARVRAVAPVPPRRLKADLDPGLEKIILRCLEKEQQWRYPTAAALADDLARWQQGEAIPVPPISQRVRRTARRVPWAKALVGTTILLLVVLCAWLAVRPQPSMGLPGQATTTVSVPPEPDYWDSVRDQLRQGKSVQLIGEIENPKKFNPDDLGGLLQEMRRPGDERYHFYLYATTAYRMELLPPGYLPQCYRIRLDLHYDEPDHGVVGIYLLRHRVTLKDGRVADTYVTATIGRHDTVIPEFKGKPEVASVCYLMAHLHPIQNWPNGATEESWNTHYPVRPTEESRNKPRRWRNLVAEVRPSGVRIFLDGKLIGEPTHRAILPLKLKPHDPLPISREEVPDAFPIDGGLGLYVHAARMFVRNLVIEPLAEE